MPPSPRPAWMLPPPPSPSRSLIGMEKAIPPAVHSPSRLHFSATADTSKPISPQPDSSGGLFGTRNDWTRSYGESLLSPPLNKDKALPPQPRRSSSVYTADAGYRYTRIIDSYQPDEQPVIRVIQPTAYRQTISPLLLSRLDEPPSPPSVPSTTSVRSLTFQAGPDSVENSPVLPPISNPSQSSVATTRNAPSFKDFASGLPKKKTTSSQHLSPPPSTRQSIPDFRPVSYVSPRRSPSPKISPKTSIVFQRSLVPAPLSIYRPSDTVIEQDRKSRSNRDEQERCESRFSRNSSEDSFVIYTGVLDYVRHRIKKRRDQSKKTEMEAKHPVIGHGEASDREDLSESRKASVQRRMSSVYRGLSSLSISGAFGQAREIKQPRGRQKQRAIPTSPYQKYGAAVWKVERKVKVDRRSAPARTTTTHSGLDHRKTNARKSADPRRNSGMTETEPGAAGPAENGRKPKLARVSAKQRRKALKMSIKMVGPTSEISDGTQTQRV